MILAAIVACEVAFWIVLVGGLSARYLARKPRLGAALLLLVPVIDVALLSLVAIDLLRGATASWEHGLAAIYLGLSVAYGRRMVAWADVRFAHRFSGGPAPEQLTGRRYTVACWQNVGRTVIMVVIAAAVLGGLILLVSDPTRTAALSDFFRVLGIIFAIDFLWAVGYTIWPKPDAPATHGESSDREVSVHAASAGERGPGAGS
ncbi:hypothetical protein JD292_03090 [Leucobacter sp. CSA2]|uniref:Uncharacterized protein n=1 Tax=Leucobacter edaphi TaxID=2796472 RepID=A0A934QC68_9MICO|nr:hypothetical protein [Leucobacter edaphi]MBK0421066.1 hypothetical protein [Leucobacter edaphi]